MNPIRRIPMGGARILLTLLMAALLVFAVAACGGSSSSSSSSTAESEAGTEEAGSEEGTAEEGETEEGETEEASSEEGETAEASYPPESTSPNFPNYVEKYGPKGVKPATKPYKVAVLLPATELPAQQSLGQGFEEGAKALNIELTVFNAGGFEPILLKGARSLWLGVELDRSMRDFDVLLPGAASKAANDLLKEQGFAPLPGAPERPNRHHLDLLFRDDMPGWIEIHRRGG
ncbi:MAG: hypothetical protein J0H06_06305, partial [Actinobacteria bacterium]|nr:hypothetical protein [Actinomycetota bacterium]